MVVPRCESGDEDWRSVAADSRPTHRCGLARAVVQCSAVAKWTARPSYQDRGAPFVARWVVVLEKKKEPRCVACKSPCKASAIFRKFGAIS